MLLITRADARALPFADGCVQTCVTSPPYWGLRDYGTATWAGGDAACDHKGGRFERGGLSSKQASNHGSGGDEARGACDKCGAVRIDAQLGLEPTPDAYVQGMVGVFREVWRALKPNGTVWINLGDSYAGARSAGGGTMAGFNDRYFGRETDGGKQSDVAISKPARTAVDGLKAKDLVGIPWMVAFALRADGWYLRSDCIWSKPNPMPESVTDRPTKSHEYVFLLSKAPSYYFDADAVREPSTYPDDDRKARSSVRDKRMPTALVAGVRPGSAVYPFRNIRSVWNIATQPYPGAHFATMPEALVSRCIRAGSRPGDLVLDPFLGSGTVARVALRLGRRAMGCDLNPAYLKLADARTFVTLGLPFAVDAESEREELKIS